MNWYKKATEELNPQAFTWEKYIGVVGYGSNDVYDFDRQRLRDDFIEIGIVDSSKIPVRPRPGKAIMVADKENNEFWFHLPKD